jgi:imidazolonepropionase-like amidohydrolase
MKRQKSAGTFLRLTCVVFAMVAVGASFGQSSAILAGGIVDPETGLLVKDQTILVENGKITAMGKGLPVPKGAAIVDLTKATVLPGYIDAHTHLCAIVDAKWDLGDFWIMAMQRRAGYRALVGAANAKQMLDAGFTTVRDAGNSGDYLDVDLKKAIDRGLIPGPTVVPAGRIIAPYGGQFWDTPAQPEALNNPEYLIADSHDELRKAIRQNLYWGSELIKIVVNGQRYQYSADDIKFIVAEAHAAGIKVAAHATTEEAAKAAIEGGVDSIEHGWKLTDEAMAQMKAKGIVLVSTDFTVQELISNGFEPNVAKRTHERYVERLRRAYAAGVVVVFGTDIMSIVPGQTRGQSALDYIDSFTEAGVSGSAIIRAMTSDAAHLLGGDKKRGTLKVGMAADIVAISGDPIKDPSSLKNVVFIMKDGKIHKRP